MLGKTHITLGLGLGALSATTFSAITQTPRLVEKQLESQMPLKPFADIGA